MSTKTSAASAKRKRSNSQANEERAPKTSRTAPLASTPPEERDTITLLTLPREIRQKILHLSCGLGIKARTQQPRVNYPWFSKVGWQMRVDEHNETHGILEKQRSNNWAELLSYVSDNIAFREDVQWVTEKWGKEIEDVVKEHQVIVSFLDYTDEHRSTALNFRQWVMRARYWKGI